MSSGVISATDYFERLRLGPEASEALVAARSGSRPRLPLEEELAIRSARVEELRLGVWRKPPPLRLPSRATTSPPRRRRSPPTPEP